MPAPALTPEENRIVDHILDAIDMVAGPTPPVTEADCEALRSRNQTAIAATIQLFSTLAALESNQRISHFISVLLEECTKQKEELKRYSEEKRAVQ